MVTAVEAFHLLNLEERVQLAARDGREALQNELVEIRLTLGAIIRTAKKSHHPDMDGDSSKFLLVDAAARFLMTEDLSKLAASILPEQVHTAAPVQALQANALNRRFCTNCRGTGQFRSGRCGACGGHGTVEV